MSAEALRQALDANDLDQASGIIANTQDESLALELQRARYDLLSNNPQGVIQRLDDNADAKQDPLGLELLADAYMQRFNFAPLGHSKPAEAQVAHRLYQTIMRQFPQYSNIGWIYYQNGCALLYLDQPNDSLTCFRNGLSLPSDRPIVKSYCYERLSYLNFYTLRDFKQASKFIKLAIAVYPKDANEVWLVQAYLLQGRILQTIGEDRAAFSAVRHAVKTARVNSHVSVQNFNETLLAAGEILAQMNEYQGQAVDYLQQYLDLRPTPTGVDVSWSRANELIGDTSFNLGHFTQATGAYRTALEYNPYHPWQISIYYRIARCYYYQRMFDDVIETINHLFKIAADESSDINDYRIYDILGSAYFACKRYTHAYKAFQRAQQLAPRRSRAYEKIQLYCDYARQLAQGEDNE
jgi:tetratricopeptide (TPR) repeat protein